MTLKPYHRTVCRVRRNTGPVGGPWVCEVGYWIPDTLRGKRDTFKVSQTLKVGTRVECELEQIEYTQKGNQPE